MTQSVPTELLVQGEWVAEPRQVSLGARQEQGQGNPKACTTLPSSPPLWAQQLVMMNPRGSHLDIQLFEEDRD